MSTKVKSYSVQELAIWLDTRPATGLLVDVREVDELFEQGTILGYDDNIPFSLLKTNPELFESKFSVLNKHDQVGWHTFYRMHEC